MLSPRVWAQHRPKNPSIIVYATTSPLSRRRFPAAMATLPEVTDLFSKLALHLQTLTNTSPINQPPEDDQSLALAISKLNHSLNIDENSRVTVLDTALSLMCFNAPEVFDSMIEYLIKAIISSLHSSVLCKVFRFKNEEILQIGGSISGRDCLELIEVFSDVIGKLEGHGLLPSLLFHAVVRVAVSTSSYKCLPSSRNIFDGRSVEGRSTAVSKLLCHLPCDFQLENHRIPPRLLFWYLDPLTLKHDVTGILHETMARPFLLLGQEFHERMPWRSIIICLVLSPVAFIETRALLHDWFLLTGLGSILEVLADVVAVMLDVISRPTWWYISPVLESAIPHSRAYFPNQHLLLRIFAGPFSEESFLQLVCATTEAIVCAGETSIIADAMKSMTIDHKSSWGLAISFPDWLYFASVLLFAQSNIQELLNCSVGPTKNWQPCVKEASSTITSAAARYIAWILSPQSSRPHQNVLADLLNKASVSWSLKQIGQDECDRENVSKRKKLKKPKLHNKEDCQTIHVWLNDYHKLCMRYSNKSIRDYASCQANLMFKRIPLGILIGCPHYKNEGLYEPLLHYAVTGRILQSIVTTNGGEYDQKEALSGACLIFGLTEIVARMAVSLFDTEESEADFILRIKLKTGKYLVKCVKRLLQLSTKKDEVQMLVDLPSRLMRWRNQGKEVSQFNEELDDVLDCLTTKLS